MSQLVWCSLFVFFALNSYSDPEIDTISVDTEIELKNLEDSNSSALVRLSFDYSYSSHTSRSFMGMSSSSSRKFKNLIAEVEKAENFKEISILYGGSNEQVLLSLDDEGKFMLPSLQNSISTANASDEVGDRDIRSIKLISKSGEVFEKKFKNGLVRNIMPVDDAAEQAYRTKFLSYPSEDLVKYFISLYVSNSNDKLQHFRDVLFSILVDRNDFGLLFEAINRVFGESDRSATYSLSNENFYRGFKKYYQESIKSPYKGKNILEFARKLADDAEHHVGFGARLSEVVAEFPFDSFSKSFLQNMLLHELRSTLVRNYKYPFSLERDFGESMKFVDLIWDIMVKERYSFSAQDLEETLDYSEESIPNSLLREMMTSEPVSSSSFLVALTERIHHKEIEIQSRKPLNRFLLNPMKTFLSSIWTSSELSCRDILGN